MKKRWWKIPAIVLGALVGLILLILLGVSLYLTPERLTGLVNKYGNDYLQNSELKLDRADLTIWRTFPHAEIELNNLSLVSTLPQVAAEGDTIAALDRLHGRINLAALLIGRISVNHVLIDRPRATVWNGPDSISNLDIFPTSEDKEESNEPLSLPSIRLNQFKIAGDARFRYISVPDSLDADVTIRSTELLDASGTPQYTFTTSAHLGAIPLLPERLEVSLDGGIGWESKHPMVISLHDFKINLDQIHTITSAAVDLTDQIKINSLDFHLLPLPLERVCKLMDDQLPEINTPATLDVKAKLLSPYIYDPDTILIPDLEATIALPSAAVSVPEYNLNLTNLEALIEAKTSAKGLDESIVDLKKLNVAFPATDVTLEATATNLQTDPKVKGCLKGDINFSNLDRRLWQMLGMRLQGLLDADIDFDFNLSNLSMNGFHEMDLLGEANIHNFKALMPADTIAFWTRHGRLSFGANEEGHKRDSLLRAVVTLDTAWVEMPDMHLNLAHAKLTAGVENKANSTDTTTVTPMGGRLQLGTARVLLADSSRAMLRDFDAALLLTRYNGMSKRPLLAAKASLKRAVYGDGVNRASIGNAEINAVAHFTQSQKRQRGDSARMRLRRDSILLANDGHERLDLGVDHSMVRLLKKWDLRGNIKASRARVATPVFPLRCRMTDLNMAFNPDSVLLQSMKLKAGRSDFALNGSITNIQKSLGRKRGGKPITLDLNLVSDSINVNQLVQAAFKGAAWQAEHDSISGVNLDLDDEQAEAEIDDETSDEMRAFVVPMNVDATFRFLAKNILYSNVLLHDFSGEVMVANGAAHLSDLQAVTDMGSALVNLLYYAPTAQDVDVGLSVELNKFRVGKLTELIPALDSIMPILNDLDGIVNMELGATTRVDSAMNVDFPTLKAMLNISGDSLKVMDDKTFKMVSKYLLFHDKKKNLIDHMSVEAAVENNTMEIYPFMFDFDRYRIGVMGHNDLDMNLNYHVSILKSPIPFKFGINIKGNPDKLKIRPGLARFKEKMVGQRIELADTLRLNLAKEIKKGVKRGTEAARIAPMEVRRPEKIEEVDGDTLSHTDSLYFIEHGLIELPDTVQTQSVPL